jgi:hypothetical protein
MITGFVNGDHVGSGLTGSPLCKTTAKSTSPAGTYPITCGRGTIVAPHYVFKYVPGTLTVS